MSVRISDLGTVPKTVEQLITINVNDTNDEQLTCGSPNEAFVYSYAETTSTSGTIGTISCNGQDSTTSLNTLILGSIVLTPNVAWINVAVSGTTITISHTAAIDYESLSVYSYGATITVLDNAGVSPSSSVTLEVDIEITNLNEATPVLTGLPATTSIDEDVAIGTSIFNATGTDTDAGSFGDLRFEITNGNTKGAFEIDEFSGQVKTADLVDSETLNTYSLEISIFDGAGLTSNAILTVNINDINDNSPICPPQIAAVNIPENHQNVNGSFLTIPCTDEDVIVDTSAVITYTITSSLPSGPFEFDSLNVNQLQVKPSAILDYETAQNFILIVEVKDSANIHTATTTVFITIDPVNEFDPSFNPSTYECNITETYVIGDIACTVYATDDDSNEDGLILYSIDAAGNQEGKFAIGSENGIITLLSTIDVDSYSRDPVTYTLTVTAEDQSFTSHRIASPAATVVINVYDVRDSGPVCELYQEFSLTENSTSPANLTDIDSLCTDEDDGEPPFTSYAIITGNSENKFAISGSQFQLINSLSFEETKYYNLTIRVCDSSSPSALCATLTVLVNVEPINKCAPEFALPNSGIFEVAITEDTPIGTTIMTLTASDCDDSTTDFGQFFFEMVNATADGSEALTVDKFSGEIITGTGVIIFTLLYCIHKI